MHECDYLAIDVLDEAVQVVLRLRCIQRDIQRPAHIHDTDRKSRQTLDHSLLSQEI